MTDVQAILDEFQRHSTDRYLWELYWRDCTHFAMPHTEAFDTAFNQGWDKAQGMLLGTPAAHKKTRDLYDQTSLWAIERLSAGLISLKTPESSYWHELDIDDPLGYEADHAEKVWMEKLRDYLFAVRASPRSGFWPAHKAGVKSVCAYGDGYYFVEDLIGGTLGTPWRYEFIPISECYAGVNAQGETDRMFRLFKLNAAQMVQKFGYDKVSIKARQAYDDPKKRSDTFKILHCVKPRAEVDHSKGNRGSAFASYYIEPDEKHRISEGGYYEFPYIRQAWSRIGARPYSEGPMALALAEVKSLNELAKNELIAAQQGVMPPTASAGDNYTRPNLNPGANNPGMVTGDGKLLLQPLITAPRPDFAQAVIEARRNTVREMLYLNLWQVLIQNSDQTATEALLRMQEKGELLGPVGISFNEGLSRMTDREIGILARKGAMNADSPLAAPDSVKSRDISPRFTSPLDRLRRSEELVGAQRMIEGMTLVASASQNPGIFRRLDQDEYIELLQDGFGAPYRLLRPKEEVEKESEPQDQAAQTAEMLALLQQGGQAAEAIGRGGSAMAEGAGAVQNNGPISSVLEGMGTMSRAA